jgi:hypothetical protein
MPDVPPVMAFSVDRGDSDGPGPARYGAKFWGIGLPDGREVMCSADRAEVTSSGALVMWQQTTLVGDLDREPTDPLVLIALPAGSWLHVYAASVMDGTPVAVDGLDAPTS